MASERLESYQLIAKQLLGEYWNEARHTLLVHFGLHVPFDAVPDLYDTAMSRNLHLIVRAAAGDLPANAPQRLRNRVETAVDALLQWAGQSTYGVLTPFFWGTSLGEMLARALLWVHAGNLITISEAAELAGVSIHVIRRRLEKGELRGYYNPDAPNPQRGGRLVRRGDVIEVETDVPHQ